MHKLVIQDDEGKTTVVPLIRDEITIGRKEGNTIRLTERNVSRKHARIVRNNGTIAIEDLNSYNGVKVNGSRIQGRVSIGLSDRVQIGDYLLELKLDNVAQAPSQIGIQPTQPINSVVPSVINAAAAVPVPQEDAPTTKISDEVMQQVANSTIPPGGMPAVSAATSSPSLPPVTTIPPTAEPSLPPTPTPAPTAPLAAQPQPPTDSQQAGRLVILSRNFAGQDYLLDRPALVIGRTDDNDVVINHRSISRHHAKVVRENGRYAIVDMQSSNGVRVNGEEYGKVELRRGDIIDLGHVRIRFVEPGESFMFTPSMAVDVSSGGGGKGMYIGIGVAVLGLILFGVFVFGDGSDSKSTPGGSGDTVADGGNPDPAVTVDAGTKAQPSEGNEELLQALERAEKAKNDKDWAEAKKHANAALAIDAGSEKAKALIDLVDKEMANKQRYDELSKLIRAPGKKDYVQIAQKFSEIDVDSVYKEEARGPHDTMKAAYVEKINTDAAKLVNQKKCKDLEKLMAQAEKAWSEDLETARETAAGCRERVAVNNTGRRPPPGGNNPPPNPGGNSSGDDDDDDGGRPRRPSKSFDEHLKDARTAYGKNEFGAVLKECRGGLKQRSSDQELLMVCTLASCKLKQTGDAKRYASRIRQTSRLTMLKQQCFSSGVSLD